jgi:hypothetical protein
VSVLESELTFLEEKFAQVRAAGGEPDAAALDLYGRLADRQRRLSEPLGWERTPRDIETLDEYLASGVHAEAATERERAARRSHPSSEDGEHTSEPPNGAGESVEDEDTEAAIDEDAGGS